MEAHPSYTAAYLHAGNTSVSLGRTDEARAIYVRGVQACVKAGDAHARGEIEGALADSPQSYILKQVTNGIAVRMAVLYLLSGVMKNEK